MHSVLVYHTINQPDGPLACPETISPERFEQQLRWLRRRKRVVRLSDTLSGARSSIAITFDDGYRDNLTTALPLLEQYELPMTLFVVAGFVGRDNYLSADEVREMARHPLVTIGSHGLWHRHFTRLSPGEARFELAESRSVLQDITGTKIEFMAWPYGECSPEVESLSAACGYRASWSVWKGSGGEHSRRRVPLGSRDNMARFIAKTAGLYALTESKWHRYQERRNHSSRLPMVERSAEGRELIA